LLKVGGVIFMPLKGTPPE